jgi:hypothetical protein
VNTGHRSRETAPSVPNRRGFPSPSRLIASRTASSILLFFPGTVHDPSPRDHRSVHPSQAAARRAGLATDPPGVQASSSVPLDVRWPRPRSFLLDAGTARTDRSFSFYNKASLGHTQTDRWLRRGEVLLVDAHRDC